MGRHQLPLRTSMAFMFCPFYAHTSTPVTAFLQSFAMAVRVTHTLNGILYLVIVLFSTLRVYAIRGRSVYWSSAVLALGIVPCATNIYNYLESYESIDGNLGCQLENRIPEDVQNKFIIATRVCAIASDVLVLVATLRTTFNQRNHAAATDAKVPLTTMILWDGSIYFVTLSILNALEIAMTVSGVFTGIEGYAEVSVAPLHCASFCTGAHHSIGSLAFCSLGSF
ncbi:hypothetical protein B0H21DRAFT_765329 [Amylocystis lapponica]|nr:hypothetical protein B0H21DRAFT_765329 [Amylocystis lapponica]